MTNWPLVTLYIKAMSFSSEARAETLQPHFPGQGSFEIRHHPGADLAFFENWGPNKISNQRALARLGSALGATF